MQSKEKRKFFVRINKNQKVFLFFCLIKNSYAQPNDEQLMPSILIDGGGAGNETGMVVCPTDAK